MAFGIYKLGQGYWVRVMTAVGIGILLLAAMAWVWGQAALIPLPNKGWSFTASGVTNTLTAGTQIQLMGEPGENQSGPQPVGTAMIEEYTSANTSSGKLVLNDIKLDQDTRPDEIQTIRVETDSAASVVRISNSQPIPILDQLYVQAASVGLMMFFGAVVIFYFVGVRRQTVDFLISTDGEMKKVNWSSRKEVMGSTWVVLGACIFLTIVLFAIDFGFSNFFKAVGVLDN